MVESAGTKETTKVAKQFVVIKRLELVFASFGKFVADVVEFLDPVEWSAVKFRGAFAFGESWKRLRYFEIIINNLVQFWYWLGAVSYTHLTLPTICSV